MDLKLGSRWRSLVCDTEVVIVRPPSGPAALACGGEPMTPHGTGPSARPQLSSDLRGGSLMGKRYLDERTKLEVLCTRSGEGSITVDGLPMKIKEAKKLPSSD
jgi:hypothetical protein